MQSIVSISFFIICVITEWSEIQGPLRNFFNADGNTATDYLQDGIKWYQMKIRLHGIHYYIPLVIRSEKTYISILMSRYEWTLTLPFNDIKTEQTKQRRSNQELNKFYGTPQEVRYSKATAYMTILKTGDDLQATIGWVNANKYYSGKEIMAIFMTIAVKKNIKFSYIGLKDASKKVCHKLHKAPFVYIFIFFLLRSLLWVYWYDVMQCVIGVATRIYGVFRAIRFLQRIWILCDW